MDDEDWDADISSTTRTKTTSNNSFQSRAFQSSFSNENKPSNSSLSFGRGRLINRNSERENLFGRGFSNREKSPLEDSPRYNTTTRRQVVDESQISDYITIDSKSIGAVIGKSGATINGIREKCNVKIDIPRREDLQYQSRTQIKIIGSSKIDIEKAKQMIEQSIHLTSRPYNNDSSTTKQQRYQDNNNNNHNYNNEYSNSFSNRPQQREPSPASPPSRSAFSFAKFRSSQQQEGEQQRSPKKEYKEDQDNQDSKDRDSKKAKTDFGQIDWDAIRAQPSQNLSKFKDHPPVIKEFYTEDAEIAKMTREQVKQFRKENFDIKVEFFKKENLSYCINPDKKQEKEKELTPEEIEEALFERVPKPVKTIEQAFKNYPEILEECRKQNFVKPTPIQSQMWPILLKGNDCVGIAQTGTGKTLAFLLPALIHIDNQITPRNQRIGPNVLVLSPTRELAIQIEQEVKKINYKQIKSVCIYGGGDRKEQANVCTKGVEIIIATPGRLYDLIQSKIVNVTSVTFLVLDEADRMLDMGFEPQIMKILLDIRPDRQTVMTSATWPQGVRRLATKYLTDPIQLYVGSLDLRAAKTVTQKLEMVQGDDDKRHRLMDIIENKMNEFDKLIVFVGRKSTADNLSCDLSLKNIQCQAIHGDREQCDREEALEDFKENRVRILIATDVASRGIDVKDITCVLNYDFPRNIEEYVHRVGRTGRAGRTGVSITFMAREDWKHAKELIEILKQGEQLVPQSLVDMAERFEAAQRKRAEEGGGSRGAGGFRRGSGGGRGGSRRGGGGFGGGFYF